MFARSFPSAPVVYVVRDPRDAMVSWWHYLNHPPYYQFNRQVTYQGSATIGQFLRRPITPFLKNSFSLKGEFSNVVERWCSHVSGWLSAPEKPLIVHYEDLYNDFENVLARLAKFLAVPRPANPTFPTRADGSGHFIRVGAPNDWINWLPPEDSAFIEETVKKAGLGNLLVSAKPADTAADRKQRASPVSEAPVVAAAAQKHPALQPKDSFGAASPETKVILFSKTDGLGSQLWATGTVAKLLESFPCARLLWFVREGHESVSTLLPGARVFRALPNAGPIAEARRIYKDEDPDTTLPWSRVTLVPVPFNAYSSYPNEGDWLVKEGWWCEFVRSLKADIAIAGTVVPNWVDQMLILAAGSPKSVGYDVPADAPAVPDGIKSLLGSRDLPLSFTEALACPPKRHEADDLAELSAAAGAGPGYAEIRLTGLAPKSTGRTRSARVIAFAPGASDPKRIYSPANLANAVAKLASASTDQLELIVLQGPQDSTACTQLVGELAQRSLPARVVEIPAADLSQGATLLANVDLLVCNESFWAHLASALNVPTVAMWGLGHWQRFTPRAGRVSVIHTEMLCQGCDWKCCFPERHCITDLPTEAIVTAARERLGDQDAQLGIRFSSYPSTQTPAKTRQALYEQAKQADLTMRERNLLQAKLSELQGQFASAPAGATPKAILFVRPDSYGDVILFEPVLRLAAKFWPGTKIGLVAQAARGDLAPLLPAHVQWFPLACNPHRVGSQSESALQALATLKAQIDQFAPDCLVAACYNKTWVEAAVANMLPEARRVALGEFTLRPLDTFDVETVFGRPLSQWYDEIVPIDESAPELVKNRRLLEYLTGRPCDEFVPSLTVPDAGRVAARELLGKLGLSPGGYFMCCPAGTANVTIKSWPAEKYGQLVARLVAEQGWAPLLTGHISERSVLEAVADTANKAGCKSVRIWLGNDGEIGVLAAL
ncbi:MAG TPA: glycosyltransferase family 9 protein, partial [Candidatus Didemnitutus sp.]|nr:glycosyltransferase family 9 protein [Candidatus Didemnitutus sp.]